MAVLNANQLRELERTLSPTVRKSGRDLKSKSEFAALLEKKGLSPEEILERIEHEMTNAETGTVRVKAAELGLKLNGLLSKDDDSAAPFSVTIVIQDSQGGDLNSILVPR